MAAASSTKTKPKLYIIIATSMIYYATAVRRFFVAVFVVYGSQWFGFGNGIINLLEY